MTEVWNGTSITAIRGRAHIAVSNPDEAMVFSLDNLIQLIMLLMLGLSPVTVLFSKRFQTHGSSVRHLLFGDVNPVGP